MFKDMGDLPAAQYEPLLRAAQRELATWLSAGTYVGWLAVHPDQPTEVIAGAGVQIRPLLPRPRPGQQTPHQGPEAIVLNVFTERAWRRRGIALRLMEVIIAWAREHGISRLVLHASPQARSL